MKTIISVIAILSCAPLFAQYQYRTDDNADIIRSILEDKVPSGRHIALPSPSPEPGAFSKDNAQQGGTASAVATASPKPKRGTSASGRKNSAGGNNAGKAGADMPAPAGADKTLLESGIRFYELGNNDAALDKLSQIRSKYASSPYIDQSEVWMARAYLRKNNPASALTELGKIPEDSGEYPYSLFLSGHIFRMQRKYDAALENYIKIASRFPGHDLADDALIEAGKIYLSQKNGQLALSSAAQIVKAYPDRENIDDAYYLIGTVLEKDQTLRDLEKAYLVFKKFVYRAEVEKADAFAKSPLLERVKDEMTYLEKNFLKGK
jgi:outer membrane protein assembly factor BamD (BamD/ComL family)